MSKRFNIRLALEEVELEVDKVVQDTIEEKSSSDTAKVLDNAVEAEEEAKEEVTATEETPAADSPVEVAPDNTTVDGTPVEEAPVETNEEVVSETPPEETKEEKTEEPAAVVEEKTDEVPAEEPAADKVEEPASEETPAVEEINEAVLNDSTSLTDVDETVRENEVNIDEVDEAINVTTSLEEIVEQLEASLDTGGITSGAAAITDIATKRLYERVGLTQPESEEIAVEGFKTPSSRIRNTKLAIEGISDKINEIFKAIVAAITRSITWIKNFINNFFKNFDSMKEKIKQLREAFSKADKSTAVMLLLDKEKFTKETVISKLKAGHTSILDVNDNVNGLVNFSEGYFRSIEKGRVDVLKAIQKIIANAKDSNQELPEGVVLSFGVPAGMQKDDVPGYAAPENLNSYASLTTLPNDSIFIAYVPRGGLEPKEREEAIKNTKFLIGIDQKNLTPVKELPILLEKEVTDFLTTLENLCDEGNKAKVIFNNFIKDKEAIKHDLDSLIRSKSSLTDKVKDKFNQVKEGSDYEAPSYKNYGLSIMAKVNALDKTYVHGSTLLSQLMINTVSAGVTYTSDCVQRYIDAGKTVKAAPATP